MRQRKEEKLMKQKIGCNNEPRKEKQRGKGIFEGVKNKERSKR
jgi:hypothetical protein